MKVVMVIIADFLLGNNQLAFRFVCIGCMLFGAMCAVVELQLALPGKIETTVPLKNVLNRRPFI